MQNTSVIGAFDDLLVIKNDDTLLRIADPTNQHELMSIQLSESIKDDNYGISPQIFTAYDNDILLLFYGSERTHRIEAYRISTGQKIWTLLKKFNSVPILIDKQLVAYGFDNTIEVYDIQNGELINQIKLTRKDNSAEQSTTKSDRIWLAGYDQTLSILHQDTGELITLNLIVRPA